MSNDMGRIIRGTTQIRQLYCLTHLHNGFSPAKTTVDIQIIFFILAAPWTSSILLSAVLHHPTALYKNFKFTTSKSTHLIFYYIILY